jgi:hypothetical protein
MFWLCMTNGAAGHTYGANGIWQCNRNGAPHGPSPTAGSPPTGYGTIAWDEAMNLPGSTQMGLGKKFFEQFEWWKFEPHAEWSANGSFATGIADKVRVIYVPERRAVEVLKLEPGVKYRARVFDPVSGKTRKLGLLPAAAESLKVPPPATQPDGEDWVLVVERAE